MATGNPSEEMMNLNQPIFNGYQLCPARIQDLEATVAMLNASSRNFFGVEKFEARDFESDWNMPDFNLERDTRLAIAPDGDIAGYCEVWDLDDPHVRIRCWGRVHPAHTGKGVGSAFLNWAEQRALQAIPKAPPDARVVLICSAPTIDQAAEPLFISAGFQQTRCYLRMVIGLDQPPPEPQWPAGITVRSFVPGEDDRIAVQALRDSFSDHYGYVASPFESDLAHWQHFWETDDIFDPTLYFLAFDGETVAGLSLCYPHIGDDRKMGWVGSLGVLRPWRRQGLGLALLHHSFLEFYRRGRLRVGLGVEAQNLTGANRLYLRAGMHSDPRWESKSYEKELRPGKELSTLSANEQ
jgi:GNAT superfamily N-acetyltransferase